MFVNFFQGQKPIHKDHGLVKPLEYQCLSAFVKYIFFTGWLQLKHIATQTISFNSQCYFPRCSFINFFHLVQCLSD